MKQKKSVFAFYIPLIAFTIFVAFPFLWTFLTSLKENNEMFQQTFNYLPKYPSFDNYWQLIQKTDFLFNMKNSAIVSAFTVLVAGTVSVMSGYAFSRYRFKSRNILLGGFLLLYLIPQTLLLIPLYMIFRQLGNSAHGCLPDCGIQHICCSLFCMADYKFYKSGSI